MAAEKIEYSRMMMTDKMSNEEFEGQLKRFGISGKSALCHVIYLKTGVIITPGSVQTHLERHGRLSAALTAMLRLLFREMERSHEHA